MLQRGRGAALGATLGAVSRVRCWVQCRVRCQARCTCWARVARAGHVRCGIWQSRVSLLCGAACSCLAAVPVGMWAYDVWVGTFRGSLLCTLEQGWVFRTKRTSRVCAGSRPGSAGWPNPALIAQSRRQNDLI